MSHSFDVHEQSASHQTLPPGILSSHRTVKSDQNDQLIAFHQRAMIGHSSIKVDLL